MARTQALPAEDVEELIAFFCKGSYPPSGPELEQMVRRFGFDVVYFEPGVLPRPVTDQEMRQVWMPKVDDETARQMLLHEAAEILMRFELAPQFQTRRQDAPHQTAVIVELRAQRSGLARRARETRQEMTSEADRVIAFIEGVKRDPRNVRTAPVQPAAERLERLAEDLVVTEEQIDRLCAELEEENF